MDASAHRAFALLKSLAYERVSCSEAEKTAANRLLEEACPLEQGKRNYSGFSCNCQQFF